MTNLIHRAVAILALLGLATLGQVALADTASASNTAPAAASVSAISLQASPVTLDCGWVTCSAYISRSATRSVANTLARYANSSNAAIGGATGVACAATGVGAVVAAGCALVGATYGGFAVDQFVHAKSTNSCIRLRFIRLPTPPYAAGPAAIYVDNSRFCKNS